MTQQPLDAEFTDPSDVNTFESVLRMLAGVFGIGSAIAAGPAQLYEQESLHTYRPTLPGLAELGEAIRRGLLDDASFRRVLGRAGYTDNVIGVLRGLVPQLVPAGELLELLRRGDIDDATYTARMGALGIEPRDAGLLSGLRWFLPPVQDVIRFMVREVFSPDVRARFGQDEDFPPDVLALTRRLGVRDDDARSYWAAHWELPSPQQGFEMFQRSTETGVTMDDLRLLLRAHDVMPYWREAMVKIAFTPITRVDVRRLHKLGLLDHAGLVDRYQRVGYNPEDAELLAQFTEQLNAQEGDDALEPFRTPLRTRARTLYLDRVISEQELRDTFASLGYTPEQVSAFVAEAEFVREADAAQEQRQAVRQLYVQGHIDTAGATSRLAALGYSPAEAAAIVEPWGPLRELRELNEAERAERDLTRADVLGAYEDALLPKGETSDLLLALGYDTTEVDVLLARVDLKRERSMRTETERTVRALYLARRLGRADATSRLATGGVAQERATLLVETWDVELDARAPELSVAQIQAALRARLLQPEAAASRLDAMGYSTEDRDVLIGLAQRGRNDAEQGS